MKFTELALIGLASLPLGFGKPLEAKPMSGWEIGALSHPMSKETLAALPKPMSKEALNALLESKGANRTVLSHAERKEKLKELNTLFLGNNSDIEFVDSKEMEKRQANCNNCRIDVSGFNFAIVNLETNTPPPPGGCGFNSVGCVREYLSAAQNGESAECLSQSNVANGWSGYGNWYDMCSKNQYVGTQPNTNNWIHVSYCENGGYSWGTQPNVFYLDWYWGELFAYCYPSNFGTYCQDKGSLFEVYTASTVAWCNWF
ncbi:hypothetical protein BGZ63DRAFT_406117 [Mariannaea sp. PMI_226]|nr:hypothetical protein BGZ63DRAFT_406117 [Mariannaea sp. PMI_226]